MSAHIDPEQAFALAALADDDPEKGAAFTHARDCRACAALLEESIEMLSLLDGSEALPAISPVLKARIERKVWGWSWDWSYLMIALFAGVSLWLVANNRPIGTSVVPPPMRCGFYEVGFALVPLAVGAALSRFGRVQLSPARFASYTMAFAVAAQLQLRTHCAAHNWSFHLFAFHFLIVLAMGAVGAGVARVLAAKA